MPRKAAKTKAPSPVNVDLKWGAWSQDRGTWDERAPGIWKRMRAAFVGKTGPLTVYSRPRKETRFGTVTVSKGKACYAFQAGWDSPSAQVPDALAEPDEVFKEARQAIWEHFCDGYGFIDGDGDSPCGAAVHGTVRVRSFERLMERIDDEGEAALLDLEKKESAAFDEFLKELVANLKPLETPDAL